METKNTKKIIEVKTTVPASINVAWDLFTNPKHITRWNYATDEWYCPFAANNLLKDGTFNYRMEARDGSAGFNFSGKYDKVNHEEILDFTLNDGRKVKVIFIPDGISTKITEAFETDSQYDPEMQKNGWQAILDNFKNYVEYTNKYQPKVYQIDIQASKIEVWLQEMFWGDYFGSCQDKYGINWMFNCAEKV